LWDLANIVTWMTVFCIGGAVCMVLMGGLDWRMVFWPAGVALP